MKFSIDPSGLSRLSKRPLVDLPVPLALPCGKKILVFAPHADDETIGCGGTLLRLKDQGCAIQVVFVTDGSGGDPHHLVQGEVIRVRREEALQAMALLGGEPPIFLDFVDGGIDPRDRRLYQALSSAIEAFSPDWILTPGLQESHRDHLIVGTLLKQIWRRKGSSARFFFYEVAGGFFPNRVVDITAVMARKRQLLDCYHLPLHYVDYQGAMEGRAKVRGLQFEKSPEGHFGEAFEEIVSDDFGVSFRAFRQFLGV